MLMADKDKQSRLVDDGYTLLRIPDEWACAYGHSAWFTSVINTIVKKARHAPPRTFVLFDKHSLAYNQMTEHWMNCSYKARVRTYSLTDMIRASGTAPIIPAFNTPEQGRMAARLGSMIDWVGLNGVFNAIGTSCNSRKNRFDKGDILEQAFVAAAPDGELEWKDKIGHDLVMGSEKLELKVCELVTSRQPLYECRLCGTKPMTRKRIDRHSMSKKHADSIRDARGMTTHPAECWSTWTKKTRITFKAVNTLRKMKPGNSGKPCSLEENKRADWYILLQSGCMAVVSYQCLQPYLTRVSDGVVASIPSEILCYIRTPDDFCLTPPPDIHFDYASRKRAIQQELIQVAFGASHQRKRCGRNDKS